MSADAKRCEECGGPFEGSPRRRQAKKAWCSDACLIKAGVLTKPERKVTKVRTLAPRLPGYQKPPRHSEGLEGSI